MLSVLVTDYLQFIVLSLGLLTVTILILGQSGWESIIGFMQESYGERAFNPFLGGTYGIDRIILDILLAFATILTWQTMITRILAARNTRTGQKIYMATSPFFLVRFVLPAFLGMAALHFFAGQGGAPDREILALPTFLALAVPSGLLGILISGMLAADMSTNSSYMLAWSSVIYNDILEPIHKNRWSQQRGLRTNRILVALIGIFLLLYGLWYPLKGDLWVYLQVTGTIYLSSMSTILIAACYWPRANNWGAIGAICFGALLPITYLILQQMPTTQAWADAIGPYKSAVAAYIMTAVAMVFGSLLKDKLKT
jgi:SSS family solute:Na+ symporter